MTVTKQTLIEKIQEQLGLNLSQATAIVENIIQLIALSIAAGKEVKITNFGTFSINHRPARQGINPYTGEKINLEASKTAVFKASNKVKSQLNTDSYDDDFITSFL